MPSSPSIIEGTQPNTNQIGLLLYTDYGYLFQICGFILFTAIIAAIMLTHRNVIFKRTQNKDFDIDIKRINVIIVPGSTLIIIGITPKKISDMYISKENKELLEFYNFMNILNYGNLPISERQYINTNMFDILS